jgi:hypothetical protein
MAVSRTVPMPRPWTTPLGVVLGQVQVALKSNEIPALRTVIQGAFLNRAAPESQPLGRRQFP